MKILTALLLALSLSVHAEDAPPLRNPANESVRHEVYAAIIKGLAYLEVLQQEDGSFRNPLIPAAAPEHPALTALPLIAFHRNPSGNAPFEPILNKGYTFLRSKVQPDGGIYIKGLSNYNTSVSLMALLNSGDPKDEPIILAARKFIGAQQATGMLKPETDGGFGYGPTGSSPKRQHPDLDNTVITLEAIRTFAQQRPTSELAQGKDLNWQAAIDFISRTQNLTATNKQAWASDDTANKGGFVYYPGFSNAGETDLPDGKKALRSYGTMTYAGLLSFIYADLPKDDQRLTAALDWLKKNYTLEENPGLGRSGLFYYYHLAAKGLACAGVRELTLPDGKKIDWARDLGVKLVGMQNADGSWLNETARWMEKDPILVTTYCVLALEIVHHQL